MSDNKCIATCEELVWQNAREDVANVNPRLAALIDCLDPSSDYTLFKIRYPFGSHIVDKGVFQVPASNGKLVPLSETDHSHSIKDKLAYSPIHPVGVATQHAAEICLYSIQRMVPFVVVEPGRVFGLWAVLDGPGTYHAGKVWTITAGARFLFMLPKITDAANYKKLNREFGIGSAVPKTLFEQSQIFTEIANHPNFTQPWHCEIIFFSKKWFEKNYPNDVNWLNLRYFFLQQAWQQSCYWRNKMIYDVIWELFVTEINRQSLRANPCLIDTIRELILISSGAVSAFKPATDEMLAPIQGLQKAYLDIYGLKEYIPTFMQPAHFHFDDSDPSVYYSLQVPTLLESVPKFKTAPSTISNLLELKELLSILLSENMRDKLRLIDDTPIYQQLTNIQYDFFHTDPDPTGEICSSKLMPEHDPILSHFTSDYGPRRFAENSPFVRGCVRITKKLKS